MKNIKYYISALIIGLTVSACEDYLTVLPENNQSSHEYWETKEEVEAVLGAGYVELRSSVETLFLWGEARGNGIENDKEGSDLQKAASKIRAMDVLPSNALAKWANPYKVIAMANSVIKYGPEVVDRDASFNVNVMNSYLSEAYFLRSLAYFYLVRTFDDVPFVTEPYVDDSAPYSLAKSKGEIILRACAANLEQSLTAAKEFFPESDNTNPMNTKGRATKWAIHALLADIYLWLGDYQLSIDNCDKVLNSGRVGLIAGNYWFANFYPGNSNEGIYEIQYSYALAQNNSFISWFSSDSYYKITEYAKNLYLENENDLRAENASYKEDKLWKYIGKNANDARNSTTEKDQNFILYRVADIYLMKAEAYIMLEKYEDATDLINKVRNRAGIDDIDVSSNQITMCSYLLKERQREFLAEGKNWFDILRIGRRSTMGSKDERFKTLMIEHVLQGVSASNQSLVRATLAKTGSWYLPIHSDELNTNTLLKQSEYYENFSSK